MSHPSLVQWRALLLVISPCAYCICSRNLSLMPRWTCLRAAFAFPAWPSRRHSWACRRSRPERCTNRCLSPYYKPLQSFTPAMARRYRATPFLGRINASPFIDCTPYDSACTRAVCRQELRLLGVPHASYGDRSIIYRSAGILTQLATTRTSIMNGTSLWRRPSPSYSRLSILLTRATRHLLLYVITT